MKDAFKGSDVTETERVLNLLYNTHIKTAVKNGGKLKSFFNQ